MGLVWQILGPLKTRIIRKSMFTFSKVPKPVREHLHFFQNRTNGIFHDFGEVFCSFNTAGNFVVHRIHGIFRDIRQYFALIVRNFIAAAERFSNLLQKSKVKSSVFQNSWQMLELQPLMFKQCPLYEYLYLWVMHYVCDWSRDDKTSDDGKDDRPPFSSSNLRQKEQA